MDTMIVEIFLPSVNQSHDFILPAHVPVGSILRYLTDVVRACANVDIDPDHPCLCDLDTRQPIPLERTLSQCGVRDSSRLMLL